MRERGQGEVLTDGEREAAQEAFLRAFATTGVISTGLRAIGVSRQAVDYWRTKPEFAERYAEAEQAANDVLRLEIHRRAVEGLTRKKFTGKGQAIIDPETGQQYVEREYSDSLLQFAAKARMPEFRETVQQNVNLTGTLSVEYAPAIVELPRAQIAEVTEGDEG